MYNNLSTSIALYCVEYNILQANLHAGNLRYLQGIHKPKMTKYIGDFNTENQNKFVYTPHMALINGPILHCLYTSVAITINPITIPRGKITCTNHIEDGKK